MKIEEVKEKIGELVENLKKLKGGDIISDNDMKLINLKLEAMEVECLANIWDQLARINSTMKQFRGL
jgi:hypothetical protein